MRNGKGGELTIRYWEFNKVKDKYILIPTTKATAITKLHKTLSRSSCKGSCPKTLNYKNKAKKLKPTLKNTNTNK